MKRIDYVPDYDCVVHAQFNKMNNLWSCVACEVSPNGHHIPEILGITLADYLSNLGLDIDSTCTYGLFDCGDFHMKFRQSGNIINIYTTYYDYKNAPHGN